MDRMTYSHLHCSMASMNCSQSTLRRQKYTSTTATATQKRECRIFFVFLSMSMQRYGKND
jgi:hypothetical protein